MILLHNNIAVMFQILYWIQYEIMLFSCYSISISMWKYPYHNYIIFMLKILDCQFTIWIIIMMIVKFEWMLYSNKYLLIFSNHFFHVMYIKLLFQIFLKSQTRQNLLIFAFQNVEVYVRGRGYDEIILDKLWFYIWMTLSFSKTTLGCVWRNKNKVEHIPIFKYYYPNVHKVQYLLCKR